METAITEKPRGVVRSIPDSRDSSVSPFSKSPLPSPPLMSKLDTRGSQPRLHSLLRNSSATGEPVPSAIDPTIGGRPQNPSSTATPATALESANDEFPFNALPGTVGHIPTNTLISNDHSPDEAADIATELPHGGLSRHPTMDGAATPPARRSVQFARSSTADLAEPAGHGRTASQDMDTTAEEGTVGREKDQSRLFTKLRALASPTVLRSHSRSLSNWTVGGESVHEQPNGNGSPAAERTGPEHGDDIGDADAEESGVDGPVNAQVQPKRRRKFRKQIDEGTTTPVASRSRTFRGPSHAEISPASAFSHRPSFLRRATMGDIPENPRAGYSEDEGRARLRGAEMLSRGSAWVERHGLSHRDSRQNTDDTVAGTKRPTGLRRLTQFTSEGRDGESSPSGPRRMDRAQTLSAQKWRQLKASMKLLAKTKQQPRLGNAKSAELMAELIAGAPAALFLASMFQRDERGHKRVPVLLEQLKLKIVATQDPEHRIDRHFPFKIQLEYGSSLARMKWTIERNVNDLLKLHSKYKLSTARQIMQLKREHERSRQPKFPKGAFPWLADVTGNKEDPELAQLEDEDNTAGEQTAGEQSGVEGEASGAARTPGLEPRRRPSMGFLRKKSSFFGATLGGTEGHGRQGSVSGKDPRQQRIEYAEWQRKQLEVWLTKMITWVMFRADSNRMCRFLELSALGVRLAAEGGYHGKEGSLSIHKLTGLDKRRDIRPSIFRTRTPEKWFLVRHSYIVCVDALEEMNIYDVFLIDSQFSCEQKSEKRKREERPQELAKRAKDSIHHRIKLSNSERYMKLSSDDERKLNQFRESIQQMASRTIWGQPHRYGSFAPVRNNVYAQFLVDGRDYMWNVSRAISMARDVIYIHDWWLSPEIYLRRPAAISQRWRLDRLLKRKADEGVKIYVIVYRNVDSAIPIDSEYTKFSLLDLSDNIYVQRSPNQMRQATFFWSHHEKICVIDHCVAFCGGVDLCFGRWDTPSHPLTDDKGTGFEVNDLPKDADHCQLWPGKDYSNPRVQDFYSLDKPYEEMYDRDNIPRMPWHDIGMQIVGQPARDLSRHFIQRWNYILRQRTPTRPTPMLLPPPDFVPTDLEALGLNGTCEVQILRSAGNWSLGTPKTEHSIMDAYVDTIRNSEHCVYMENQFFITTLHNSRTQILNKIGDALVERAIRAHENGEDWRCIIIIPLVPGYQNTVDQQDGSSVRLIMQCQYWSICRGETSIFGRLRERNINPADYIEFYSLRSWGRIGPNEALTTEQLYIHAKIMVVDDRIAIIGSANINERSLLGNRDSEIAAIVRDTDMIPSHMAGQPYMVGRFAHDMRMRLMREHLGLDVDQIREEEEAAKWESETQPKTGVTSPSKPLRQAANEDGLQDHGTASEDELVTREEILHSFNHDNDWEQASNPNIKVNKKKTMDPRVMGNEKHRQDVDGEGADKMQDHDKKAHDLHARDTVIDRFGREILVSKIAPEGRGSLERPGITNKKASPSGSSAEISEETKKIPSLDLPPAKITRMNTVALGLPHLSTLPSLPIMDDTDIGGPPMLRSISGQVNDMSQFFSANPNLAEVFAKGRPLVTKDCMRDPLNPAFYNQIWDAVARNNTKLFRSVFRCMPDDEVQTWKDYKEFAAFSERFAQSQGLKKSKARAEEEAQGKSGPPGHNAKINGPGSLAKAMGEEASRVVPPKLKDRLLSSRQSRVDAEKADSVAADEKPSHGVDGGIKRWATEQEQSGEVQDEKTGLKDALRQHEGLLNGVMKEPNGADRNVTISDSEKRAEAEQTTSATDSSNVTRARTNTTSTNLTGTTTNATSATTTGITGSTSIRRKRAATGRSAAGFDTNAILPKEDAEMVLEQVQGSLVQFPYDWLEKEEQGTGAWMWHVDSIAPLEIFA